MSFLDDFRREPDPEPDARERLMLLRERTIASAASAPQPTAVREPLLTRLAGSLQSHARLVGFTCLALVIVGVGLGARRLWPRVRGAASNLASPAPATPAGDPATETPPSAATTPTDAAPHALAADIQLPARARRRVRAPASTSDGPEALTGVSIGSDTAPDPGIAQPGDALERTTKVARETNSSNASSSAARATYTTGDAGVIPPEATDSESLIKFRPAPPGLRTNAMVISLIVDEQGRVESVKAVVAPRNIGESLILMSALSAAKTWRFHPATKDGQPVRFEQILTLTD